MTGMKPTIKWLLALAVSLLAGCDVSEDRSGCPDTGTLEVRMDWSRLPAGAEPPQRMQAYFYPEGAPVHSGTGGAATLSAAVTRGSYRMLLHSLDAGGTTISGCDGALEDGSLVVERQPALRGDDWATSGYPLIVSPDAFYLWTAMDPVAVETGRTSVVRALPEPYIKCLQVIVNMSGQFDAVTGCRMEASGVAPGLRLHDRMLQGDPAAVRPGGVRRVDGYTFTAGLVGKHEAVPSMLYFRVDYLSLRTDFLSLDITGALHEINLPEKQQVTITVDMQVTDKQGVGFETELIDWEYVSQGNIDTGFNQ